MSEERDNQTTNRPSWFDPKTTKVLWAAMCAMVIDVHAPQDNLSPEEWEHAERLYRSLDEDMNRGR